MIGTSQPKIMADFYEKVLGRKPDMSEGEWAGWQVGGAFLSIGAHSEVKGTAKEPARLIFNFETKDVVSEFNRIKALGATVIKEPYKMQETDDHLSIATFADPDGNYFQLMIPWDSSK